MFPKPYIMNRTSISLILFSLISIHSIGQTNYIRLPAVGVSFLLNDYVTPQRIRSESLAQVVHNGNWAHINQMGSGIGLHYFQGLFNHLDFEANISGSFVRNILPGEVSDDNSFLVEADASVNIKLVTDHYFFTPYLALGAGAGKYQVYYSAFVPVGIGFKFNLFDEAAIFLSSQYRIPVTTETNNFHFMHSIGIAGVISQKKPALVKPLSGS